MKGRPEHADRRDADADWAALDDAALARRVADAGARPDTAAEAELCRRLAPRARLYGLRHLRDRHAAADLAQQVTMMMLERVRKGELRDPSRLGSFVLGMCRIVVIDSRRTERRRERLLEAFADDVPSADPALAPRLDHARVERCLRALPERERAVLVLSFYDDRAAQDVAAELGLTEGNVRVIRHRGLARLRACVESGGGAA
jgi:RNA polymerase sigma-70 factor (ECF subfamily)